MPSGWTVDTLREFIIAVLAERDRGVEKLASETTQRFRDANEWRETVTQMIANSVSRPEAEGQWHNFSGRLSTLEKGGVYLTREAYEQAHEALRAQIEIQRTGLSEHVNQDLVWQADLRQQITSLRARMIGATAAVASIMAVVVALVAILRINA